jgi:hypothetical protein
MCLWASDLLGGRAAVIRKVNSDFKTEARDRIPFSQARNLGRRLGVDLVSFITQDDFLLDFNSLRLLEGVVRKSALAVLGPIIVPENQRASWETEMSENPIRLVGNTGGTDESQQRVSAVSEIENYVQIRLLSELCVYPSPEE